MAVQIVLDVTNEFVSGSESGTPYIVKLDVGGYDYAVVQVIGIPVTVNFKHTNDSGAIEGVSDGSAVSSTNYVTLQGYDLSDGSLVTSIANDGIIRFESFGRFLSIEADGEPMSVGKLLVRLYKIN